LQTNHHDIASAARLAHCRNFSAAVKSGPRGAAGGILVSIVPPPPPDELAGKYGVRAEMLGSQARSDQLEEIAKLVDSGQVRPVVENVFPLAEARRAHELIETGHTRGKIVLKVG
jgi:NADPH:quinone reductase-like Zn-dependent oxidoreductase